MQRVLDALGIALLVGAVSAFGAGIYALGDRKDLGALYWLVVGALTLKSATELLRPRSSSR
ncbi:MAG: hypothetical protein WBE98_18540 [Gammaproteobacteria bacterium]